MTIEWHRNNHHGGFYRRSLVPVKHMNDNGWHKKTAFDWGCWEQGRYQCGFAKSCGSDKTGFAFRNKMRVPNVFPDGDYVFAMVWYGGVHWRRKRGFFSDYHTCAYVKIRGGKLASSHKPTYTPGRSNSKDVPAGKCISSKRFVGECGGEECTGKTFFAAPGEFDKGRTPSSVTLKDLKSDVDVPERKIDNKRPAKTEKEREQGGRQEDKAKEFLSPTPSMTKNPSRPPMPSPTTGAITIPDLAPTTQFPGAEILPTTTPEGASSPLAERFSPDSTRDPSTLQQTPVAA